MRLSWYYDAWEDYLYWQMYDKKTLKKINELVKDIARNGNTGIGKPEPLKENLAGWWSRRINDEDRLVYKIDEDEEVCLILQCKGHYDC
jgi:toxin YoeB